MTTTSQNVFIPVCRQRLTDCGKYQKDVFYLGGVLCLCPKPLEARLTILKCDPYRNVTVSALSEEYKDFIQLNCNYLAVDVRGTGNSQGPLAPDEYSTIERDDIMHIIRWIRRQSAWFNVVRQRVCLYGISYSACSALQTAFGLSTGAAKASTCADCACTAQLITAVHKTTAPGLITTPPSSSSASLQVAAAAVSTPTLSSTQADAVTRLLACENDTCAVCETVSLAVLMHPSDDHYRTDVHWMGGVQPIGDALEYRFALTAEHMMPAVVRPLPSSSSDRKKHGASIPAAAVVSAPIMPVAPVTPVAPAAPVTAPSFSSVMRDEMASACSVSAHPMPSDDGDITVNVNHMDTSVEWLQKSLRNPIHDAKARAYWNTKRIAAKDLRKITIPTFVYGGYHDLYSEVSYRLHKYLPYNVTLISDQGHEKPDSLNQWLDWWFTNYNTLFASRDATNTNASNNNNKSNTVADVADGKNTSGNESKALFLRRVQNVGNFFAMTKGVPQHLPCAFALTPFYSQAQAPIAPLLPIVPNGGDVKTWKMATAQEAAPVPVPMRVSLPETTTTTQSPTHAKMYQQGNISAPLQPETRRLLKNGINVGPFYRFIECNVSHVPFGTEEMHNTDKILRKPSGWINPEASLTWDIAFPFACSNVNSHHQYLASQAPPPMVVDGSPTVRFVAEVPILDHKEQAFADTATHGTAAAAASVPEGKSSRTSSSSSIGIGCASESDSNDYDGASYDFYVVGWLLEQQPTDSNATPSNNDKWSVVSIGAQRYASPGDVRNSPNAASNSASGPSFTDHHTFLPHLSASSPSSSASSSSSSSFSSHKCSKLKRVNVEFELSPICRMLSNIRQSEQARASSPSTSLSSSSSSSSSFSSRLLGAPRWRLVITMSCLPLLVPQAWNSHLFVREDTLLFTCPVVASSSCSLITSSYPTFGPMLPFDPPGELDKFALLRHSLHVTPSLDTISYELRSVESYPKLYGEALNLRVTSSPVSPSLSVSLSPPLTTTTTTTAMAPALIVSATPPRQQQIAVRAPSLRATITQPARYRCIDFIKKLFCVRVPTDDALVQTDVQKQPAYSCALSPSPASASRLFLQSQSLENMPRDSAIRAVSLRTNISFKEWYFYEKNSSVYASLVVFNEQQEQNRQAACGRARAPLAKYVVHRSVSYPSNNNNPSLADTTYPFGSVVEGDTLAVCPYRSTITLAPIVIPFQL